MTPLNSDDQTRATATAQDSAVECLTYTVTEAARLLGIGRGSAYTHVRTGQIPSITIGGRIVIPRRALEAMLDVDTDQAS
ncbi:MAG: helix-turn-helix domain-containing protein [Acidimicrobiales bacterium]